MGIDTAVAASKTNLKWAKGGVVSDPDRYRKRKLDPNRIDINTLHIRNTASC
jgi:hypothetical protein